MAFLAPSESISTKAKPRERPVSLIGDESYFFNGSYALKKLAYVFFGGTPCEIAYIQSCHLPAPFVVEAHGLCLGTASENDSVSEIGVGIL